MSDADAGWMLRHRDGVEHGPFRLADLVAAATAGNIAADTQVRHPVHSRGTWVLATRVQPIAAAMPGAARPVAGRPRSETPPETSSPSKPTPPAQSPAAQSPAAQSPPTQSPAAQSPPAQSPAAQSPAAQSPAAQSPAAQPTAAQRSEVTSAATSPAQESIFDAPLRAEPRQEDPAEVSDESFAPTRYGTSGRARRDESFPVPRTFLSALQALVTDFRFRKFVTPWIVKILWAIFFAIAVLELLAVVYVLFVQPSMSAPGPRTAEGGWEFAPLQGQSFLQLRMVVFFLWASIISLGLVCLRVIAELILVFFSVSGDLAEVRRIVWEKVNEPPV